MYGAGAKLINLYNKINFRPNTPFVTTSSYCCISIHYIMTLPPSWCQGYAIVAAPRWFPNSQRVPRGSSEFWYRSRYSCSDTLTWVGWLAVTDLSEAVGQKSTFGSTWERESLDDSHLKFSVSETCSCLRKEGRHEFERSSFSKKKQSQHQQAVKANNQPTIKESCSFPLNSDLKSHF